MIQRVFSVMLFLVDLVSNNLTSQRPIIYNSPLSDQKVQCSQIYNRRHELETFQFHYQRICYQILSELICPLLFMYYISSKRNIFTLVILEQQSKIVSIKMKPVSLKMVIKHKKQPNTYNPLTSQSVPHTPPIAHQSTPRNQDKQTQIQALKQLVKNLAGSLQKMIPTLKKQTSPQYQIEHRDRKIRYPMPIVNQDQKLSKQTLQLWIAGLCREVFSAAFHKLQYAQLSYEQAKIYCAQNIISNILSLTEAHQITSADLKIIDRHIHTEISAYMGAKYPLTETNVINKALESVIKNVNNLKSIQNDVFYIFSKNSFGFEYRDSGNYNDLIMKFINFLIECIDQGLQTPGAPSANTAYDEFYKQMHELFTSLESKQWMYEGGRKGDKSPTKSHTSLQEDKYKSDVQKYTSYLIGRKISENVPKYSELQIENMQMTIKHPSILRILTKWCEELLGKFQQNYFLGKIQNFVSVKGRNIIIAYEWIKQAINEEIQIQRIQIKEYLEELQRNNYDQQEIHLVRSLKANSFTNIEKIQRSAGIFAVNTLKNLHSYIILYLNRIIHGLLKVSKKTAEKILKKYNRWNIHPNLISFGVSDLMRCKIASKQKEIYRLYQQLKRISDSESSKFKIVRIKNRLKKNTNDILINIKFRQKYLCQIQLAINSDQSNFMQCSNKFCHFIYELERSIFGPLTELCSIWNSLDPRAKIYEKMAKKMIIQSHSKKSLCKSKSDHRMRQYRFPFICSECNYNYSQITCFEPHRWCDDCNAYWICGKCQLKHYSQQELKERLFVKYDEEIWKTVAEKVQDEEDIPQYGVCCYIQSKNMKLKRFKRIQTVEIRGIFAKENNKIQMIAELQKQQNQIKFKKKFIIFQIATEEFKRQVDITVQEVQKNFYLPKKIEQIYSQEKDRISLINKGVTNENCEYIMKGNLGGFQKIKFLQMTSNYLTNIAFITKSFTKLQKLLISQNHIKSIDNVSALTSLQILDLRKNQIQELPLQLFSMQSLKELNISENLLTELPPQIIQLKNLQKLTVKGLNLQKLPSTFGQFRSLKQLNLAQNSLSSVPEQIMSLNHLEELSLNQNFISHVPDWIATLTNLKSLQLNSNILCSMPNSFQKIRVMELYLESNKFQRLEFIPPQTISMMSVAYNEISFIRQDFFKHCSQLLRFNISHNKITHLPPSAKKCVNLFYLDVSHNKITQTTQVLKVAQLSLAHNPLIKINYMIFQHQNYLRWLDVSFTLLPTFPQQIQYIQNLSYLNISGMICDLESLGILKNFKYLQKLHITQMNLVKFPASLKELHYLSVLDGSQNKLSDFDDDFFKKLTYLNELDLHQNQIKRLPSSFLYCKKLRKINLSQNDLQDFPLVAFDFPMIKQINLQGNPKIQTEKNSANIDLPYEFKKMKELFEALFKRKRKDNDGKESFLDSIIKRAYGEAKKKIRANSPTKAPPPLLEEESKLNSVVQPLAKILESSQLQQNNSKQPQS